MAIRNCRRAITLIEVLVVIFILGLLIAFLLPVTRGTHETAYRNQCQGRIKQIGLALLNHESAFGRFPLISSRHDPQLSAANTARPASAVPGPTEAGWSWIVRILPYLEEADLYKTIQSESADFKIETGPFAPSITAPGKAPTGHCSCVFLPALVCPNWGGNTNTNSNTSIDVARRDPRSARICERQWKSRSHELQSDRRYSHGRWRGRWKMAACC